MNILGIESSCDECAASIVSDGKNIKSSVIATQVDFHREYMGVVPEIASRKHTEWIQGVVEKSLEQSGLSLHDIDGIAVTQKPGLIGALLVGLSFAKGLSFSTGIPWVGVDHILAHLYAPCLEYDVEYPALGLLVSGGHTLIAKLDSIDAVSVLGATIDDACGEAFDKVAKFYEIGYPGGALIDKLSEKGNCEAFAFPKPWLHKGDDHEFDVSYSGLKTAVINQLDQFWDGKSEKSKENICASFQKTAVDMIIKPLKKAIQKTGITRLVTGGGVIANSYLRRCLLDLDGVTTYLPSMPLCTDNASMIAGLGYHYLKKGESFDYSETAESRVRRFRKCYP